MSRLQNIEQAFEVVKKLNLPDNSNAKRIKILPQQVARDEINIHAPLFLHITRL
jgi:hypothetical protein